MDHKDNWIAETWFKNHVAEYQTHGDLKVLLWKEPGTILYHVRFVFDGSRMHVTGDIGTASFWFTEKADVFNQCNYNLGYFLEKLETCKGDRYNFSKKKALRTLREWLNKAKEEAKEYDHDEMRDLFEACRGCSNSNEWYEIVNNHSHILSELDCDYWEWIYDIGNETPNRLRAYLVALKMAAKQLAIEVA